MHRIWAYDAQDLAAVRAGQVDPGDVTPYAIWDFETPFAGGKNTLAGVAWDPQARRIFMSAKLQEGAYPVIHVYKVV